MNFFRIILYGQQNVGVYSKINKDNSAVCACYCDGVCTIMAYCATIEVTGLGRAVLILSVVVTPSNEVCGIEC
jgi:hypothetical protein